MLSKSFKRIPWYSLLPKMDFSALLLELALLIIGTIFIYGTGTQSGGDLAEKWHRQILWIVIGLGVYLTTALVDYRLLARYSCFLYAAGILLLLLLFPFGLEINNAKSWLRLPGIGLLQPSELVKPTVLLFMAFAASHHAIRHSKIPLWLPVIAIGALPILLVCLQPDYGTAIVFFPMGASIIFTTGLKWRWIFMWLAILIVASPLLFMSLKPHQKERVKNFIEAPARSLLFAVSSTVNQPTRERWQEKLEDFLQPELGRKRDNWNAIQALHAVGSGGMTGKGFRKGIQHSLGFLPKNVAPTDFIFSVIAEETGFLGGGAVVAMLFGLFLCFCRTAFLARNTLGSCIAISAAAILATHSIINIGMTIQAVPIIGIPLPFVSYGGSFVIGMMATAGLVQNVHIRRKSGKENHE